MLGLVAAWCSYALPALASGTLFTRFGAPNVSNSVRQGQTATYRAVLVKSDGTIIDSVAASWSITAGPATVDSNGVVTGGAVNTNTPATLVATFSDPVLTDGVTLSNTRELTIQASQDHWTGGTVPGQGGDARAFTTVGSTTLVAIYGGGIRRTFDGVNWGQSGYGIPFFGSAFVRNLRVVPNTTSQVLAAVEGRGIYRSSDGGATWTPSNAGMGCNFPFGFSARNSTNTLYVASNCGVYKSSDGGNTWTGTPLIQPIRNVVAFGSSDTVWAATFGNGLYRSTDAGATWVQMNNGLSGPNGLLVYSFSAPTSNPFLVMVEGSGIFRSSDGGATWVPQNSGLPASYGFVGGIGFIFPGAGSNGYFYVSVEGYGIFRGTTGANASDPVTWTAWGNTASRLPMSARTPALINGYYYVATGRGVYRSADDGVTWTQVNAGLPGGQVRSSATDPTNTNVVYASADTVYKSTDGGAAWVQADNGITATVGGFRRGGGTIFRTSDGALYMNTGNAGIFKSTNGAISWAPVNTGLPALIGQGVVVRSGLTSAPQTLYALFREDARGVYKTSNGGASWTSITGDLTGSALYVQAIVTDPATGYLYLGTDAGLYKSINDGTNWTPVYTASPVNFVRIDTGTTPSSVYWSTYFNDNYNTPQAASGVYRSADGGATYSQLLSGTLVQNFRALRPGGVLTLIVASWNLDQATNGVLKSTDGGVTWQTINAGLSHRFLNSFDPVNQQILHASTRGGGVFSFVPDPAAAPSVPAAPTGVGATLSGNDIVMSWSAVTGATGYNIYMANQSGVTKSNYLSLTGGHIHANVTSPYTHASAAPGTYYLAVTALNATGESVESSEVSITVLAGGDTQAPSAPSLTATAISSSQINLAWSASSDNVGVTQYKIYRGGSLLTTLTETQLVTSYSDTGLTASTAYSYTAQACDAAGNCSAQSASVCAATSPSGSCGFTAALEPGFNLIGNSLNLTLNVVPIFGNQDAPTAITSNILTIWKWNAVDGRWAFHSPQLTVAGNAAYAASKGYEVLSTINPGEGYWVNAISAMSLPVQSGTNFNWNSFNFAALPSGFNLVATASNVMPSQFNYNVSATPPSTGVIPTTNFVSLWAWDAVAGNWYFYSPLLESSGGLAAVKSYADSHFFLHFQDYNKKIDVGVGFWVNRP